MERLDVLDDDVGKQLFDAELRPRAARRLGRPFRLGVRTLEEAG
ncbi:MAG: hypothetical protein SFX72_08040 [Isosphaeraceae bacterium]|nr:hypothetical protein [Isosphaeraceae bacterium]